MSERKDDTPEQDEPSRNERKKPGSYYYDDSTGYEIYDPVKDDEEDENDDGESEDIVKS